MLDPPDGNRKSKSVKDAVSDLQKNRYRGNCTHIHIVNTNPTFSIEDAGGSQGGLLSSAWSLRKWLMGEITPVKALTPV